MRAWKQHQQKGKAIATCTDCNRKIYHNEASEIVSILPLAFRHRVCPAKKSSTVQ